MMVSLLHLMAAMSFLSWAARLRPNFGAQISPHPMTHSVGQHIAMTSAAKVAPHQLRVQPLGFPAGWSNTSIAVFPALDVLVDASETQTYERTAVAGMAFNPLASLQLADDVGASRYRNDVGAKHMIATPTESEASPVKSPSPRLVRAKPSTGMDTVTSFDLASFKGSWYQIYGAGRASNVAFGNTALMSYYILKADGCIQVVNKGIAPDGIPTKVVGLMTPSDLPGEWKLSFNRFLKGKPKTYQYRDLETPYSRLDPIVKGNTGNDFSAPDYQGDHFIYKLGPLVDNQYDYVIVGGRVEPQSEAEIAVLARDPRRFLQKYDVEVQDWLIERGLTLKRTWLYISERE